VVISGGNPPGAPAVARRRAPVDDDGAPLGYAGQARYAPRGTAYAQPAPPPGYPQYPQYPQLPLFQLFGRN
jgi:hypothetical protein